MMRLLSLVSVRAALVCAMAALAVGCASGKDAQIVAQGEEIEALKKRVERLEAAASTNNALVQESPTPAAGSGFTRVGEGRYEVERATFDKANNDLASLAQTARIVPAFEGGKCIGFKLFSIRSGSFFANAGIRNGDVVTHVNGREINAPDKALETYQATKSAEKIVVNISRRGTPVTHEYFIVDTKEVSK